MINSRRCCCDAARASRADRKDELAPRQHAVQGLDRPAGHAKPHEEMSVWRLPRKGEQRRARVHHRTLGEETGAPHRVSRACKGLQQGVGEGTPPC